MLLTNNRLEIDIKQQAKGFVTYWLAGNARADNDRWLSTVITISYLPSYTIGGVFSTPLQGCTCTTFFSFYCTIPPSFYWSLKAAKNIVPRIGRMNVSELVETSPFQRDGNSDRDREESKTKKNKQERQTSYLIVQFSHISTTVGNEKEKKPSRAPNNLA